MFRKSRVDYYREWTTTGSGLPEQRAYVVLLRERDVMFRKSLADYYMEGDYRNKGRM
jgi:hypothetical protein